jgi:hypothetical protein
VIERERSSDGQPRDDCSRYGGYVCERLEGELNGWDFDAEHAQDACVGRIMWNRLGRDWFAAPVSAPVRAADLIHADEQGEGS